MKMKDLIEGPEFTKPKNVPAWDPERKNVITYVVFLQQHGQNKKITASYTEFGAKEIVRVLEKYDAYYQKYQGKFIIKKISNSLLNP